MTFTNETMKNEKKNKIKHCHVSHQSEKCIKPARFMYVHVLLRVHYINVCETYFMSKQKKLN